MIEQTDAAPGKGQGAPAESDGELLLSLRGVSKAFGGVKVLRDITMDVRRDEVVALLGENGAGKSTLKNILSGLLSPDSGEIKPSSAIRTTGRTTRRSPDPSASLPAPERTRTI